MIHLVILNKKHITPVNVFDDEQHKGTNLNIYCIHNYSTHHVLTRSLSESNINTLVTIQLVTFTLNM